MNIGHSIKSLRKRKGLSQKEFAEICEISPSYLSQIEKNQKNPHTGTLKTLADKLDVPLPIIYFLSMEEMDIKPEKRDAFNLLEPTMKAMISTFFTDTTA